ncbi:MAG: GTP cyclohydrolase I FolE2 [Methylococcaceae bacterium]|nr:MAG: GTP cyclohydrolase I FolE2 [Methylococcaceae bacterium]
MSTIQHTPFIDDVHRFEDTRCIAIDRVGIKDIRHPLTILGRDGSSQSSVATFSMCVDLPHHQKGTHMSRFVAMLNSDIDALDINNFAHTAHAMAKRLEAGHGYLEAAFPYFVRKKAPVSGVSSWLDYQVTVTGIWRDGEADTCLQVVIPVTSLCPCSKKISEYGAHNQRSHVTLTVRPVAELWIEDLIDLVEKEASCELYGLLKRADEKYVTERAYNNPKFVEDTVRDIASRLEADARVGYYKVETENFESIHNHSAYAMIERHK